MASGVLCVATGSFWEPSILRRKAHWEGDSSSLGVPPVWQSLQTSQTQHVPNVSPFANGSARGTKRKPTLCNDPLG